MDSSEFSSYGSHRGDIIKRAFDLVVASIGLILVSPLFLGLAVWIKLDSPGPIFYRATRTGRYGVPFRMFKFRTMVPNADKIGGQSTGRDDPRVTRAGRILRAYKLDEIPQLINVIRGEMSLVGPRPEVPQYTALYKGDERAILAVRPGITEPASLEFANLAEILGSENPDAVYEETVMPKKNALRLQYVQERSFFGDLKILLRTLPRIVAR